MKIHLPDNKRTWIVLSMAIPIFFWSLSEVLVMIVSGVNRTIYRHVQNIPSKKPGILTIIGKDSTEQISLTDIKFPLSGKSDPRFAHDRFQLQMTGLLEVEKPDIYWIGTDSDDGSWIWIDGKKILDNGGLHSRQEKIGFVHLQKGIHFVELKFENLMGEAYLEVFWIPPNSPRQPLPLFPHPFGRFTPYLFNLSHLFFKVSQYWVFFLVPFLLYKTLFPYEPHTGDIRKSQYKRKAGFSCNE